MKKTQNPYLHFPNFILRSPLLHYNYFVELTSKDIISDNLLKHKLQDRIIQEAFFLASPALFFEMEKWMSNTSEPKNVKKLRYSIIKYLTRMSTRATPFGLFAGCARGKIVSGKTKIKIGAAHQHRRHTRLDMNYLVALSQDLEANTVLRDKLKFFPNTSIYKSGNQLRYIEYYYLDSRRQHRIVEVDDTPYLKKVLEEATTGKLLNNLVKLLIDEDISREEAQTFILDLVHNQVLVSELEPSVSGPEFMEQIRDTLIKIDAPSEDLKIIQELEEMLCQLDISMGNPHTKYMRIAETLDSLPTTYNLNFLFQTDMELTAIKSELSDSVISDLKKLMSLLNKISPHKENDNLSKFKQAFYQRYEDREMPLAKVLDVETGIGYIQDHGRGDINPLIDNIVLANMANSSTQSQEEWNSVNKTLQEKLIQCDRENAHKICLNDNDFFGLESNWENLPDTISAMIELIVEEGKEKIKCSGFSGSSAINLIARFCHGDKALAEFADEIARVEHELNPNKIIAEIIHLPEARVGNILMRPTFREFEIPYLAKSLQNSENQITLDDLRISVRYDKIVLRSQKHDKEIIPRLSNAHNFTNNSLPVYHFLCDMQAQSFRGSLGLDMTFLGNSRDFMPRIEYGNVIIGNAVWRVRVKEIEDLLKVVDSPSKLKEQTTAFRRNRRIPPIAVLIEGDNELPINFNNITSIRILFDIVKNWDEFFLSEILISEDRVVSGKDDYYTNQLIVSFYNNNKLAAIKAVGNAH